MTSTPTVDLDLWTAVAAEAGLPALDPERARLVLGLAGADAPAPRVIAALAAEAVALRRGRRPKLVELGDGRVGWVFDPLAGPSEIPRLAELRRAAVVRIAEALALEGLRLAEIARLLDVPERTLRRWRHRPKAPPNGRTAGIGVRRR